MSIEMKHITPNHTVILTSNCTFKECCDYISDFRKDLNFDYDISNYYYDGPEHRLMKSRIPEGPIKIVSRYDRVNGQEIPYEHCRIDCFQNENKYYSIGTNESENIVVSRTTYHDENHPFIYEGYWEFYKERYNDPEQQMGLSYPSFDSEYPEYDRQFHIDDFTISIDKDRNFDLYSIKHVLMGSCNCSFASYRSNPSELDLLYSDKYTEGCQTISFTVAQEVIQEVKELEGIEEIIDLSKFDIIPKPDEKIKERIRLKKYSGIV